MRRLIVNADDFGLTSGVNRAITEAHRSGIVTSATLMANAPAFEEAIRVSREQPRLGVGCHLVFVDGVPVSAPSAIPTMVAVPSSRFRASLGRFAARALLGGLKDAQVEAEAIAQIHKIQRAGVTVSHVDTHKHTHLFPAILQPVLRAARACGVSAIRNPIEPSFSQLAADGLWKRRAQIKILRVLAKDFRSHVHAAGLRTTDGALALLVTGSLTLDLFRGIVENIPEGTWEFVCHPGYEDAALLESGTRLLGSRREELKILTSDAARRIIADAAIQLISFRDLGNS